MKCRVSFSKGQFQQEHMCSYIITGAYRFLYKQGFRVSAGMLAQLDLSTDLTFL